MSAETTKREATATELLAYGPEPRDDSESARNFYARQFAWLRDREGTL